MTPITLTIHVSKNEIYPKRIYAGTRGSFGLTKLNFELSPEWDGAACTVVFHPKRGKPISVAWAGVPIDVPYEIMQYSGISSFVFSGTVYTDGKAEGKRISLPGEIEVLYTLEDEGINTKGFTPELYSQILALIGNLGDLTTESKKNLVSAINEAAQSGGEVIDEKAVIEIIKKYIDENSISVNWNDVIGRPEPSTDIGNDKTNTTKYATPAAVYGYVSAYISSALTYRGSISFASLPALEAKNKNSVYNITDSFTTTANFIEGAGHSYGAGQNVAIAEVTTGVYKYDVLSQPIDLSGYVEDSDMHEITNEEFDALWESVMGG